LERFRKKIDKLNKKVDADKREKVKAILNRYGLQLSDGTQRKETEKLIEDMMNSVSIPEQKLIDDYLLETTDWEDWLDQYKPFFYRVIPKILCDFIEDQVWHNLIDYSTDLENDWTHKSFNRFWIALKDPELEKAFWEEIRRSEADNPNYRIPEWMAEKYKAHYAEILEIKKRIKQKNIEETIREVSKLRAEGSLEYAEALEQDLLKHNIVLEIEDE
jgi:hypothetical protein